MNERTFHDRLHALGPFVLRVGIAVVLAHNGLQRAVGMFRDDGPQTASAAVAEASQALGTVTPDGIRVHADWASLLGIGEIAVAGLLVLGFATRLVAIPTLALLGYGLIVGFPQGRLPHDATAMILLAVACLSLLVSGGGCLSLGRPRLRSRSHSAQPAQEPPANTGRYQPNRFVGMAHGSWTQRLKDWLGRLSPRRKHAQLEAASPAKRWHWRR